MKLTHYPGDGTVDQVDVEVVETYDYAGAGGQVSSLLTTNTFNDLGFLVSQTYDSLGRLEDLTYPVCQGSAACPSDALTVRNTYQADYLVAVGTPSNATAGVAVTYQANGQWSTLAHSNGPDRRPGRHAPAEQDHGFRRQSGSTVRHRDLRLRRLRQHLGDGRRSLRVRPAP